ncbi:MAG: 2-C-methyl-D-erythritol 2,4-cyclodiphosphate synthase [Bacilli bacterium]|nr:2-C-methyl-D-erythritol 2,4-cyclodiphosphate synthase [Bacilli bacterium]
MRVGFGEDIHLLVEGRPLILGGVKLPYEKGLLGHSDGDALLHAISDALLGAIGAGDIGRLFPPSDPTIKGIDSALILRKCLGLVAKEGYHIVNVDANVVTEEPRLRPHIDGMVAHLASLLGVNSGQVSIKAKTNEGCDAVGEKKAIRCNAVVLLEKDV